MSRLKAANLLLASASPRRRELLAILGLPFDVIAADVTEVPCADESPLSLAIRLSRDKARGALCKRGRGAYALDSIIVACDTVVALDGDILGKPRGAAEAGAMLRRLRGRFHAVYSAVTLLKTSAGHALTDAARTRVTMRPYTDFAITAYVSSGDPLDKAGAYAIQHSGFHPVAELQGCYANVMGLPLCHLTRCLRAWGIEPSRDIPAVCQAHTAHACEVYTTILAGQPDASPL